MSKSVYRLQGKRKARNRKLLYVTIPVVAVIFIATGFVMSVRDGADPKVTTDALEKSPSEPQQSGTHSVKGRYMFSGTIVLGRGVEQQAQIAGGYNYAQPFSQFASFKPEQYDGWLADLECPVTTNNISFRQQVDTLQFNCRLEWLPELTKYIRFINLANNHTGDMGAAGFVETQKTLEAAGVQIVGTPNPANKEDTCEVMALPVRLQKRGGEEEQSTLPVAFCAWQYFFRNPQPGELEIMERYAKIMPVFSFMHAGAEYYPAAAQNQVDIAHRLIDLGSEFVIGNSPHWVQNSEVYKDKLIVYSTGNFIFDQLDVETNRGLNMDIAFQANYDKNLEAWLKLGESCKARGDTCLEQAEKSGLKKINLSYDYLPVASAGGYKQLTKRGDQALQSAVEKRLDWANTLQKLPSSGNRSVR